MELNPREQCIWLAAFIDGEGCITIGSQNNGRSFFVRVQMTNNNIGLIRMAQSIVGYGSITRNRRAYALLLSGDNTYNTLNDILPFLIAKHRQAELAIELIERIRLNNGHIRLSEDELEIRRDIQRECNSLNHL